MVLKNELEELKMVDYYGRWTYEHNTPEVEKTDCDMIADWIVDELHYKPKTSIENLVSMIILHFDDPDNYPEYGEDFTVEGCKCYVEDSNGPAEFDYYC